MFSFYNTLSLQLMNNIFKLREEIPNNIRHVSEFSRSIVKSRPTELKLFHTYNNSQNI